MMNAVNVLNYGFQILMGRMLGVTDYGILSVLFSFQMLALVPVWVLSGAVARYVSEYGASGDKAALDAVFAMLVRFSLYAAAAVGAAGILFSKFINSYFAIGGVGLVWVVAAASALGYLTAPVTGALQGLKRFNALGLVTLIFPGVKVVLGFVLVALGFGVYGAVWPVAVGYALTVAAGYMIVRKRISFSRVFSVDSGGPAVGKYVYSSIAISVLMALFNNVDIIAVKRYFSPHEAGLYSAAALIGKMIMYAPNALVAVMLPLVAEAGKTGAKPLKIFARTLFYSFFLILAAAAAVNLFPERLLTLLMGREYAEASVYMLPVTAMVFFLSLILIIMNYGLARGVTGPLKYSLFGGALVLAVVLFMFHATVFQVVWIICGVSAAVAAFNLYFIFAGKYGID